MKSDITDVIADFVLQTAPGLESRLEDQAEALREAKCTDPAVGQWIVASDVKYLLSIFALEDKDFAAKFPTMAHITGPERQQFIATIEAHCEQCPHCSLKRGYDLEWDARIKQSCKQNNNVLLKLLEEDETDLSEEGEHQNMELKTALSMGE